MMTQTYIDSGASTFQADAIDASAGQLVLVDFWAAWCGPCRSLAPILEKLADEYRGSMKLVKVDTDREQALAGQFGIRSLPTVLFFKDGQVVDQFMGAVPESEIRRKIDQYVSSPYDQALAEAQELRAAGRSEDAEAILRALIESAPDRDDAKLQLTQHLASAGDIAGARSVAETVSMEGQLSPEFKAFRANLEFLEGGEGEGDSTTLAAQLEEDPDNLELRYRLARLLVAEKQYAPAMDHLLDIIRRDRQFEDDGARKTMIKVFELLGGKGELVSEYRTRLSRTLF